MNALNPERSRIPLRHRTEYAALRLFMGTFAVLPPSAAMRLAAGLAGLGAVLAPGQLRRAERRLQAVFPEKSRRQVRRIAQEAWRNLFWNAAEMAYAPRLTPAWIRRHISLKELPMLDQLRHEYGGLIVCIPHLGNWELAGLGLSVLGYPAITIVRRQRNRLVDAYLDRIRSQHGLLCLDRDDPRISRRILRHLKSGGLFALLPDVRAKRDAVTVSFLGGEASVPRGMATLAHVTRLPILPAYTLRSGPLQHEWRVLQPVVGDAASDRESAIRETTQRVFRQMEEIIRRYPEQYFWFNRRWILDPLK